MTIEVTIKNNDSRESAVISVEETTNPNYAKLLKAGESVSLYVHDGNEIVVKYAQEGGAA